LLLATVLRIIWVLYATRTPVGYHDPVFYIGYGVAIAAGDGYALPAVGAQEAGYTAYYPIGYPAVLAGLFWLVQHTPIPDNLFRAATFFQAFLGVASVWLVFETARRLFDTKVALVAALWMALFPNLIFHTATYLTETLYNFLVLVAVLLLIAPSWRERRLVWWRIVAFGIILGLSVLVRPISLLLLPVLAAVWFFGGFGWRRTLAYSSVAALATVAMIVPWSIRNFVVMDSPVLISTNLGDNLCIGHHPGARGHFALPNVCFNPDPYVGLTRHEFEVRRNDDNTQTAIDFAREHPAAEAQLLLRKAYYTWENDYDGLAAVESYNDDPFIGSRLSVGLVPALVQPEQVEGVADALAGPLGVPPAEIERAVAEGRRGDPTAVVVLAEDVEGETAFELRELGIPGLRTPRPDSALRTFLTRTANIYFFVTIAAGTVGMWGLVRAPRDLRRIFFLWALLALAASPLPFFGDPRFHVPAIPFLAVTASWFAVEVFRNLPKLIAPREGSLAVVEVPKRERSVTDDDAL
jgi:hypothetical protein